MNLKRIIYYTMTTFASVLITMGIADLFNLNAPQMITLGVFLGNVSQIILDTITRIYEAQNDQTTRS